MFLCALSIKTKMLTDLFIPSLNLEIIISSTVEIDKTEKILSTSIDSNQAKQLKQLWILILELFYYSGVFSEKIKTSALSHMAYLHLYKSIDRPFHI